MGLYSRVEYEEEIAIIEKLEAAATRKLVAGKITGFRFNELRDELEALRASADGKLRIVPLLIAEREAVERAVKNCGIVGHKGKYTLCTKCYPKKRTW